MKRLPALLSALLVCLSFTSTSQAAVIAIIDTGILPLPELVPYIVPGGWDFVNNDPDPTDDNGHGSVIAAIAVGSSNFTARVLPVKVLDAAGFGLIDWGRQGIDFAAARPDVRILNFTSQMTVYDPGTVASLQNAAAAGKIIVMAAGNSGLPNPDFPAGVVNTLGGRGIAVGAVGPDNIIRPYSARAGGSMNFYLVAHDGLGLGLLGTSFTAPQVSGAAASVLHNAPFLSPDQVVDILLRTAVDLGAPGSDPVYGRGLLNPAAALMPVGQTVIPLGDDVSDLGASIASLALELGPAVGSALLENSQLAKTLILDEYKRPFAVDLEDLVTIHDPTPTLSSLMGDLRGMSVPMDIPLARDHKLSMWVSQSIAGEDPCSGFCDYDPSEIATDIALSLSGMSNSGLRYWLNLNMDPSDVFGLLNRYSMDSAALLSKRSLLSPFLSFGNQTDSMALGYQLGNRVDVTFGFVTTDEDETYGRRSDAALIEGLYKVSNTTSITAQLGTLAEDGSVFGGSSKGAFGVDEANTTAVTVGTRLQLRRSIALTGHYTWGYTRVDDIKHSLLHDFSDLRSEAVGAALLANNVFRKNDRFALAVSRPLRVTSGSVDLKLPQARDSAGNLFSGTQRVSLVPQREQTDIEISYRYPLRQQTTVGANIVYRDQPHHSQRFESEIGLYAVIRHDF